MMIKKPELIHVTLSNGDMALFVNGKEFISLEHWEKRAQGTPLQIGEHLAKLLNVDIQKIDCETPADEEWQWDDVFAQLPPRTAATASARTEPLIVSLDGGVTYAPAPEGVRIVTEVYLLTDDSEETGELHINATTEGIIMDLLVTREEPLDTNLGTSSEEYLDISERLMAAQQKS